MASITTIALMLVLLGAFSLFSINARHIMAVAGQQPPIEITLAIDVTEEDRAAIDTALQANTAVLEYQLYTPEENFEKFQASVDDDGLFDDFPVENIPYTYTVRLNDPSRGEEFQAWAGSLPGVRKVSLELSVMKFLSEAIVWVNYATVAAFIVLSVISFFIISNMVRVAVFSRGEEISIMKYVGATNWYIRVPYILEGGLVGLIGAFIAWLVTLLAYGKLFDILMAGTQTTDILAMVHTSELSLQLLLINILIGAGVGALGSAVSVRRHIQV
ncbi:MAG TPA: hypothetical protein DD640_07605 [Clostridiales bacterium]|nr:hypothetical protein [Clostridiales bacterium]